MSTRKWTYPQYPTPQFMVLDGLIQAWTTWDIEGMIWQFDENYEHRVLPASMNRAVLSLDQQAAYLRLIRPMFTDMKVTIEDVLEVGDKIVAWVVYESTSTTGYPYHNEVTVTIRFVPNRDSHGRPKIRELTEFMDSQYTIAWHQAERARQRAAGR